MNHSLSRFCAILSLTACIKSLHDFALISGLRCCVLILKGQDWRCSETRPTSSIPQVVTGLKCEEKNHLL